MLRVLGAREVQAPWPAQRRYHGVFNRLPDCSGRQPSKSFIRPPFDRTFRRSVPDLPSMERPAFRAMWKSCRVVMVCPLRGNGLSFMVRPLCLVRCVERRYLAQNAARGGSRRRDSRHGTWRWSPSGTHRATCFLPSSRAQIARVPLGWRVVDRRENELDGISLTSRSAAAAPMPRAPRTTQGRARHIPRA